MRRGARPTRRLADLRLAGSWGLGLLLLTTGLALPLRAANAVLWQIGAANQSNSEFALAPGGYGEYRDDGWFVVGSSDAKRDWPYVHPGPEDGWAGGRPHRFVVTFGLETAPTAGDCRLRVELLDTHSRVPPELRIEVNGREFTQELPPGGGDGSIFGEPTKGKRFSFEVPFPATLLRAGANEIALTTRRGSWMLYDAITLEAPPGLRLTSVSGTMVDAVESPPVLVRRGSDVAQVAKVGLRHSGGEKRGSVRVTTADGRELGRSEFILASTRTSIEVPMAPVEKPLTAQVRVELAGEVLATREVVLRPVRHWVVYLLPHSHVDIGYTHVQTDVERAQWKYLEMAIETAQRTASYPVGARFKWNVEVLWAVDGYLRQATPEKQQAFIEAVRAGQVGLQALYGNQLTGLCRPEELLRLVDFAGQLSQRCGVPIESAMITDVPGYTWGMVPALAHSGVRYFSIGPNGGDRIGHTAAAWGDKPFWWIGPNGRDRLLVWMTGTGYYQVFQSPDKLLGYLDQLDERKYPYDFVQVRHCLGDNGAPDTGFADKVRAWNETHAFPRLVIATSEEMFRDFEKRYGSEIPTARGDFTPYWEDGAASSARETAMNRASADRLVQAETLYALRNPRAYPVEAFDQAWRNVLLYDEHTWGAHNSISQPDHPFVKSQWAIKQAFALDADRQSRALLEGAVRAANAADSDGTQAFDVCSTLSFAVPYGLVTVPRGLSTGGDAIGDLCTQRLSTGELVFRPCWGGHFARRFHVTNGASAKPPRELARVEGMTLTTSNSAAARWIKLRLDERTGAIASLVFDGHELVDPAAPTALNDYFYLPGSDLAGLKRNGPVRISVKERGPWIASLLVESEAPGCRSLTREVRVHALRNYVEIINTVDKLPVRAKEGVHFGFGFNVPGGTMRMDVPWGVVRPEIDQIPGACKNWFTVQRWVDVSNDRFGVTWMTPDAPLVEVGGITANLIGSLSDPKAWLDKLEPSATLYSWAMNNHWHTNYRAEQEGPTVFRYIIWPHTGPFDPVEAAQRALEISQPLVVVPATGDEPAQLPRFHRTNQEVLITALRPSRDGRALIVRLFGASGKDQKTRLEWSEPKPRSVSLSNTAEQPGQAVIGPIEVPAWTIVTLRAELP